MIFKKAQVTNVTANIGKGEIKLTFTVPVTEIQTAAELALYTDREHGKVTLNIMPWQLAMLEPDGATGMEFSTHYEPVHKEKTVEWHKVEPDEEDEQLDVSAETEVGEQREVGDIPGQTI